MIKSQKSDTEKNNLIEEDKRKYIDEMIRQNEIISGNLKSLKYKTILSYYSKCEKI